MAAAITDAWWPVAPFGLQEPDLSAFAGEFPLYVHPRSGRLYAQPAHLFEYVNRVFYDRRTLPVKGCKDWRKRLIRLPY